MTKLQTRYAHKKLTSITVNGRTYDIDANCCVDVDNAADVKKLLSLGDEWTSNVAAMTRAAVSKIPVPGRPMRTAVEFVALLAQDAELANKVANLRSFQSLSSLAFNLGFKFTENEFRSATEAFQKDEDRSRAIEEKNAAKAAKAEEPAAEPEKKPKEKKGKGKGKEAVAADAAPTSTVPQAPLSDHKFSEALPEALPEEETGEWPDPEPEFSSAYLVRMGAAYDVDVSGMAKADMVSTIHRVMYG